jgi:hypothetical protein
VQAISDQVSAMIEDFRKDWLAITRGRQLPGMIWRGEFELELKRNPRNGSHAYALLKSMGCDMRPLTCDERYLIVHTHFVVVLPEMPIDINGQFAADEFRRMIQSVWIGKWQTQTKGLYAVPTVSENITNIYNYCTKRRLEYSTGGLDDETVKFYAPYELVWNRFVTSVYRGFESAFRSKR